MGFVCLDNGTGPTDVVVRQAITITSILLLKRKPSVSDMRCVHAYMCMKEVEGEKNNDSVVIILLWISALFKNY